jgi:hypothetical protein
MPVQQQTTEMKVGHSTRWYSWIFRLMRWGEDKKIQTSNYLVNVNWVDSFFSYGRKIVCLRGFTWCQLDWRFNVNWVDRSRFRRQGRAEQGYFNSRRTLDYLPQWTLLSRETSAQDVVKEKAGPKTPHFLSLNHDIVAWPKGEKLG